VSPAEPLGSERVWVWFAGRLDAPFLMIQHTAGQDAGSTLRDRSGVEPPPHPVSPEPP